MAGEQAALGGIRSLRLAAQVVAGQGGGFVIAPQVEQQAGEVVARQVPGFTAQRQGLPEGGFRFREIAPGSYDVEVSLDGFQTTRVEGVTLALGSTTDLPVKVAIAQLTETLTVTAEAAVIDPSSSGTSTNLTNDYLQNLPTGRFQPDVLNYAPGINLDVAFGTGTGAANAYQIDGIDTSDPEGGTPWSFVNYNIIDEVQLVGLGAPAEYGSFTGIVFNSVTKSGSNEIKGLAEFLYTGESLADEFDDADFEGLNPRLEQQVDSTVQFGGPLRQDKLWYFLSAQYFKDESSSGGPIRTEESPRAFGKLSWQANESNNVETWVEWDRYDIIGRGADAVTPIEATVTEDAPELVWNVAWLTTGAVLLGELFGSPIINPVGLVACVVLGLPLAMFFSAVCIALGVFARSTKEGQYYLMPLVLVTMPLVILPMSPL